MGPQYRLSCMRILSSYSRSRPVLRHNYVSFQNKQKKKKCQISSRVSQLDLMANISFCSHKFTSRTRIVKLQICANQTSFQMITIPSVFNSDPSATSTVGEWRRNRAFVFVLIFSRLSTASHYLSQSSQGYAL